MKYRYFYIAIAVLIAACTSAELSPSSQSDNQASSKLKVVRVDKKSIVTGQTIYVPIYSHIYHEDEYKILNLAATLSIRNTDLTNSMIITSVRYYDSDGKLVRQYITQPVQLGAMASCDFVVARTDSSGGVGANFIVEWVAEKKISDPVVEAVMIGTESSQGISFISSGRVIKSVTSEQ